MLTTRLRVQLVPSPDSQCDLQGLCLTSSVRFPNLSAQRVAQESQATDPGAASQLIMESETEDESWQRPRDRRPQPIGADPPLAELPGRPFKCKYDASA